MSCEACRSDFRLIDRSMHEHSVVEVYVCFTCGSERYRAISEKWDGRSFAQLGGMETEGNDGRSDRREDS